MDNKLRVAFKLNGGMGTFIIEMNFIKYFYDKFSDLVEISVFAFKNPVNEEVFGEQYFVTEYHSRGEFKEKDFDLAIDINWFPKVVRFNKSALPDTENAAILKSTVQKWSDFANNRRTKFFFTPDTNMFDPNIHSYAIIMEKNRMQLADIGDLLGVGRSYDLNIPTHDEEEILSKFGLDDRSYITLQQGVDFACNTKASPKQWPNAYYSRLCEICRERWPDVKFVQLGEEENNIPIESADLCLLGQTNLAELKAILKNSILHIDGDCGMVHLRRAMHGGPNIVLYGNLPSEVYGYDEDIKITSDVCKYPCAKLFNSWKRRCLISDTPLCMEAIKPEQIAGIIDDYLEAIDSDESPEDYIARYNQKPPMVYEKILAEPGIKLDSEWVEGWLKTVPIYDYRIEKVKLSRLIFSKLTSQGYRLVPLSKAPAYQHLQGDKSAYPKYMELYQKYQPDTERSEERFEALLESLESGGYDDSSIIAVDGSYRIVDGAHRASWLMHKYGEDHEVTVLKLYYLSPFLNMD